MSINDIYFHYQDFKKDKWHYDPYDKSLAHGRFFLKPDVNLQSEISMEWIVGSKTFNLSTQVSKGYVAEHTLQLIFAIPPIALYTNITWPWLEKRKWWSKLVKEDNDIVKHTLQDGTKITKHAENLETGIRFFNWTLWVNIHQNTNESKSTDPWWKEFNIDFKDWMLGEMEYKTEIIDTMPVKIPMPEKEYDGIADVKKITKKRKKWYPKIDYYTEITVENGISHPGKGTASYNCGMDGLVSSSVRGEDVRGAIANFVKVVTERRLKYPL